MKDIQKYSLKTITVSAILAIALVGCGAQESDSTSTANEAPANSSTAEAPQTETPVTEEDADATQYPITIKHAFGETTIESKPERVATIQWGNHDVALALGVVPVGFSAANYGVQDDSGLLPWTKEKLDELGVTDPNVYHDTDGLDFEAISDSAPDVILATYSGITQEDYDTLSQIAPVIPYQETAWVTTWQDQVLYNAMGMGMQAEGEKLIEDTENLIKEKSSAYADIQGKTAAFVYITPTDLSLLSVYAPGDPRGDFLMELGMTFPEGLASLVSEDSFYLQLSAENADALKDTDIIVTYGDENLLSALQADPLLGKVPAIERGSVVVIGDNTPLAAAGNPNPLSIASTIDEYLELIDASAKKVNE
ncbi:iron-siderophore ABC transporter substrate-binding protein [Paenibacillus urinalis]|uniref:iron-siderophore ABC transporter substrate-binding protein n=1 Tax=Paenibacillus urinalis TaxID=521520 RepID=UPI00236854F9|nr:iron-siderophore ABC transporter substrate-binding protein [Paenibacillus urinalis]WDH98658.1 iron-siderophore ABC transporter substrate-binding protein [Paenibacillus urinalis]